MEYSQPRLPTSFESKDNREKKIQNQTAYLGAGVGMHFCG